MKKIITFIFVSFLFLFLGVFQIKYVHADSPELSIETVLPDNQINKKVTYFDLNISPNLQQNLVLKVKNNGSNPLNIDVDITDGYTTFNGDLDYSITDTSKKISAPLSIKELIVPDKREINLGAKEEQEVSLKVSIPSDIQEGILLGGVRFSQHKESGDDNSEKESVSNQYAYVKGIQLTYGKVPNVKLESDNARLSNIQHNPTVLFDISNKTASLGLGIQLKTRVEERNSGKVIANDTSKIDIAPYANVTLPVKIGEEKLPAGEYKLIINLQGKGIEEEQVLYFKVTKEESQKTKEVASQVERYIPTWIIIVGILFLLLLLVLIVIIIYQRKKRISASK